VAKLLKLAMLGRKLQAADEETGCLHTNPILAGGGMLG
jgi:hypothetical protein